MPDKGYVVAGQYGYNIGMFLLDSYGVHQKTNTWTGSTQRLTDTAYGATRTTDGGYLMVGVARFQEARPVGEQTETTERRRLQSASRIRLGR